MINDYRASATPNESIHEYARLFDMKPRQIAYMLHAAGCRVDGRLLRGVSEKKTAVEPPAPAPQVRKEPKPTRTGIRIGELLPVWLL